MGARPAQQASQKEAIKALILDGIGAKRVADWCGVSVDAVWQMLSRATDDNPFPVKRALQVIRAARAAGVDADLSPLTRLFGLEPAP
jgi:hypothetical protein